MKIIGTHSGSFHADDALGVAILKALHPGAQVVRSRDPDVWATCDALVDVGGEYVPSANRFDHHQKGFFERRSNSIPYAGSGLVWKTHGASYVQLVCTTLSAEKAQAVAEEVDIRLIQHADAIDSGIAVDCPPAFSLSGIIDTLNATWQDAGSDDEARFEEAYSLAGIVLRNQVRAVAAELSAAALVRQAPTLSNGKILVLDAARLPYDPIVCAEMPEVLFVVYPESKGGQHQVRVVPRRLGSFHARADLPADWAGLRDEALARKTGVEDAVFCHNGRFICGAASKEGALKLAHLAVKALK